MARRTSPIRQATSWVRVQVYRLGLRPKPGSILFSPSLDLLYQLADVYPQIQEALRGKK